jgi:hypothetical protein
MELPGAPVGGIAVGGTDVVAIAGTVGVGGGGVLLGRMVGVGTGVGGVNRESAHPRVKNNAVQAITRVRIEVRI